MARTPPASADYLPRYRTLGDDVLLAMPEKGALTPLTLFVCTYVGWLENICVKVPDLTRIMCERPHGCLIAFNSNYGHAAQPGEERYIKVPKPPPVRHVPARGRPRKLQGDGTCFNSAIEPVIRVGLPGIPKGKVYFPKCFPTTGEAQVPGTVLPDLSDGHCVLQALVDYLNELGVGKGGELIRIKSELPNMLNYKFRIRRNSPRVLIDLLRLAEYMELLEQAGAVAVAANAVAVAANAEGAAPAAAAAPVPALEALFAEKGWPAVVLPPYLVREVKAPTDDMKTSFRFKADKGAPLINVFQAGKINILGAKTVESGRQIHAYFTRLFTRLWDRLICLQPRRDNEVRAPAPAPPPLPPAPPPVPLTAEDIDEILWGVAAPAPPAPSKEGPIPIFAPSEGRPIPIEELLSAQLSEWEEYVGEGDGEDDDEDGAGDSEKEFA